MPEWRSFDFASTPLLSLDPLQFLLLPICPIEFEWVRELLKLWNPPLFAAKFILFKGKITAQIEKNRVRKWRLTKKSKHRRERGTATAIATTTVRPSWLTPGHGPCFPNAAFWGVALDCSLCLRSAVLVLLGLFCYLSWLGLASSPLFSPNTCSIRVNLESKYKQVDT